MVKKEALSALPGYSAFLEEVKGRIRQAQLQAGLAVNRELVFLYWHMGREILLKQSEQGWGAGVIDQLSIDLKQAFPDMK